MTPARRRIAQSITLLLGLGLAFGGTASASGAGYERISGSGSSWAGNAVAQWLADVKAQGVTVDYDPTGSSTGRKQFAQSLKQFAVSEIPYTGDTADPQDTTVPTTPYTLMPTVERGGFGAAQGATLGYFTQYALCEGQRTMGPLGYSPLPMNLVLAAMTEVRKIPGVDAATLAKLDAVAAGATAAGADNPCNNPTFKPGDDPARNVLVATAKFPAGCDAGCQAPWTNASTNAAVAPAGAGPVAVGGAVAPPTGTTAVDAPVPEEVCDPDTGVCATAEATLDSTSSVQAIPTVLAGQNGWAGPQTLMALVGALLVALVLAPPLVTRLVSKSRRGGISRP